MRRRKFLHIALLYIALLFAAGAAHAAFAPSEWKFVKPIALPSGIGDGEYVKVYLDNEASIGARRDLGDVRIATGDGAEVPYQLLVENESIRSAYLATAMRDLSTKDGVTMFILDLGAEGFIHDRLNIVTGTKNFKKNVAVYAANEPLAHEDPDWRLLTGSGYIYNFFDGISGFNAGSGEVHYPESTSRYLRVVIGKGEWPVVEVSGANVFRYSSRAAAERRMTLAGTTAENLKYKTTEIVVDLGGEGIPTRRVTLSTDDSRSFHRRVVVEGSSDARHWTTLENGYVFSLKTPLFTGKELSIAYPETTHRYIRVVVLNEDDTPVEWSPTLVLEGVLRALVFEAKWGNAYALYYGNENAALPRYDLARYFQYIESAGLPLAALGPAAPNLAYTPPLAPPAPYTAKHPRILDAALVFLVAVVTFLTVAYLKKLKLGTPPPPR